MQKNIFRLALFDDHAAVHKDHAIGHFTGKAHFVRNHNHRHTRFRQIGHHLQHFAHEFRVKRRCRFVKQQSLRPHCQTSSNRNTLLLTAGKACGISVGFFSQTDALEHFHGLLLGLGFVDAGDEFRCQGNVLKNGLVRPEIKALEHHSEMFTNFIDIGLRRSDVNIIYINLAAGGFFQCIDAAKHCGLAGAGRS